MFSKTIFNYLTAGVLAIAVITNANAADKAPATQPLTLKVYNNPDPKGFQVSSTLVMGQKDAILFDAQFTQSDVHRVVADILESGKNLTTVFVSEGDPDYYFGLNVVKQAFPNAKIVTTPAILAHIKASIAKKLEVWGPKLGGNGPATIIYPEAWNGNALELEGQRLEVNYGIGEKKDSPFIWIPSIKTVLGGVLIFNDLHVWTAYANPTKEMRTDWVKSLEKIAALKPDVVIPGHLKAGSAQTIAAVNFTHDYLITYEKEVAKAKDSSELIAAMKKNYPDVGFDVVLEISAKVTKGEMKWE